MICRSAPAALLLLLTASLDAVAQHHIGPPDASAAQLQLYRPRAGDPTRSAPVASIDTARRGEVLRLYHDVYRAPVAAINWTGNLAGCVPGEVSRAYNQDTLQRINYYRVMSGLPGEVVFSEGKNALSQAAALIMAAENALSHFPPSDWRCYSAAGAAGAAAANLALGFAGVDSVDAFIRDDGANNTAVGHRRWLLYPPAREMGSGSIPGGAGKPASNAIHVVGDFGPRPATPRWVAWPNPGYTPLPLLPERWSFALAGADFGSASVRLQLYGAALQTPVISRGAGAGDPALVWRLTPPATADQDLRYQVNIAGVRVDGVSRSYRYQVIVTDPFRVEPVTLSGPATVPVGVAGDYRLGAIAETDRYRVRVSRTDARVWDEGAENGLGRIVDDSDPSYPLRSRVFAARGEYAFHLSFIDFTAQRFTLDRLLVPAADSVLRFRQRFGFVTSDSALLAEVSLDEGVSWQTVWRRVGAGQDTDAGFSAVSVPLGDYAGRLIKLRFSLVSDGIVYLGASANTGVHIDDIRINNSLQLTPSSTQRADASEFVFTPTQTGNYMLHAQPLIGGYQAAYGPGLAVSVGGDSGVIFADQFE